MNVAIYPGSFDPVTYGHLDIIQRSLRIFDRVIVALLVNPAKKPLFTLDERQSMLEYEVASRSLDNVEVDSFSGLLVEYAANKKVKVLIRGLRAISDFEYELQIAAINRQLNPDIETFFLMSNTSHSFISSNMVKSVAMHGADVSGLVSRHVANQLSTKFGLN